MWLLLVPLMAVASKVSYNSLNKKDKRHVARLANSYCKSVPVRDEGLVVKRMNQPFWYN